MLVNERIKAIRKSIGITQSKFAERIAISTSYMAEIEHGVKTANERVIRLLVAEFNINEHWLRFGDGDMFNHGMDSLVAKTLSLLKSLDPKFQECAIKQLEELVYLYNSSSQKELIKQNI